MINQKNCTGFTKIIPSNYQKKSSNAEHGGINFKKILQNIPGKEGEIWITKIDFDYA